MSGPPTTSRWWRCRYFAIGGVGWAVFGLYHGAKSVIAREFDPNKVLDFFRDYGISKLFLVPAAMQFIVRQPRAREMDFSKLRYIMYGASPIPPPCSRNASAYSAAASCRCTG